MPSSFSADAAAHNAYIATYLRALRRPRKRPTT